jgi:metallo-beta-lactamase class B
MTPQSSLIPSPQRFSRRAALAGLAASLVASLADSVLSPPAMAFDAHPDWTTPLPPFRIAGNLYYVGSRDLASYLVTTPQGHILINSNLVTSPPQIRASVEKLGFHFREIRILLLSQAHYDHAAGAAAVLKDTGAKYMVMEGDARDVESGGKTNFQFGHRKDMQFPAAKVDRVLRDGDTVRLGETVLTAHKTAGHTVGCTSWSMVCQENSTRHNAVIVGGPTVLDSYNLVDDKLYPNMANDFATGFRTLKSLPCDLFLGAHGEYFGLLQKYRRWQSGDKNAFLDPAGYQAYIAERQQAFETELERQRNVRRKA